MASQYRDRNAQPAMPHSGVPPMNRMMHGGPYPPGLPPAVELAQVHHVRQLHGSLGEVFHAARAGEAQILHRLEASESLLTSMLGELQGAVDKLAKRVDVLDARAAAPQGLPPAERDALARLLTKQADGAGARMRTLLEKVAAMETTLAEVAEHVMDPEAAAPEIIKCDAGVNTIGSLSRPVLSPVPRSTFPMASAYDAPRTPSLHHESPLPSMPAPLSPSPSPSSASASAPPETFSALLATASAGPSRRPLLRTDTSNSAILARQREQVYALDFDEYARGSPVHTDLADVSPTDELCSVSAAGVEDLLSSHPASSPIVLKSESPALNPAESSPSIVEVELSASPRKRRRTSPSPHVDFAALYTPGSSGSVSAKRRRTATAPASGQTTLGSEFTFDYVQCSGCGGWWHTKCAGVRHSSTFRSVSFRCSTCRADLQRSPSKPLGARSVNQPNAPPIPPSGCLRPGCNLVPPTSVPECILGRQEGAEGFLYLVKWKGYSERCATWKASDAHIEPLLITFHDAAREEGHDPDLHFDFFLEKAESANGPWKYQ